MNRKQQRRRSGCDKRNLVWNKSNFRNDLKCVADGGINRFRRRGDADAIDERGGHDFFQPQIERKLNADGKRRRR